MICRDDDMKGGLSGHLFLLSGFLQFIFHGNACSALCGKGLYGWCDNFAAQST